MGPQYQIIGGTLTYTTGWAHEVTVIPTPIETGGSLALDRLVTHPTPTLADYDPTLTLAELGRVTIGLAP
jgi:hypothetical protein